VYYLIMCRYFHREDSQDLELNSIIQSKENPSNYRIKSAVIIDETVINVTRDFEC
jgi:hypothetical protein